jgi:ferritin-like metal-binding protein YciE
MDNAQHKVAQYLGEARASEQALVRVLQSQIAMAPRGEYRTALEDHLVETRDHAARLSARLGGLGRGPSVAGAAVALGQSVVGQALALGKTPLDLLRGSGGAEKVLKNAKDACATEALEIATYTALGRLARDVGDEPTAALADAILAEEVAMLERVMLLLPALTDAVVGSDVRGHAAPVAPVAPKAPTPAPSTEPVDEEPWPGYDRLTAAEIKAVLAEGDAERGQRVRIYERAHKDRSSVLLAATRQHSEVS